MRITLVESPEIGIIGVGEGTFPSIRGTLSAIGIDEARFVRECHATFKQGVKFANWVRPGQGSFGADHYFHPFSHPSQRQGSAELLPYWLAGLAGEGVPFAQAATMQKRVADAARGPKRTSDADYLGPMNYAYHFDAGRFAKLLAEHGKTLGVAHLLGNVERVELADDGAIARVHTREHGALEADLYVDCTGFRAALIGEAMGSPFRKIDDVLFVDRALAAGAVSGRRHADRFVHHLHRARSGMDLGHRPAGAARGRLRVFELKHTSDARAEEVLRAYIGPAADALTPRQLQLNVGYRDLQWVKNCVAVGLSGGFLEPLESSGIGLIETAAYLIGFLFPFNGQTRASCAQLQCPDAPALRARGRLHQAALLPDPAQRAVLARQCRPGLDSRHPARQAGHMAGAGAAPARFRDRSGDVPTLELAVRAVRDGVPDRPACERHPARAARPGARRVRDHRRAGRTRAGGPAAAPRTGGAYVCESERAMI
ncbi:tryptophan 7-halogenase [Massilia sp. H-1]|nr:tryptophan 7-halogenase [Massilia sp. H-1]